MRPSRIVRTLGVDAFCRKMRSSGVSPFALFRAAWMAEPELGPSPMRPSPWGLLPEVSWMKAWEGMVKSSKRRVAVWIGPVRQRRLADQYEGGGMEGELT